MTILKVQGEFDAFLEAHKDVELEDEVRKFYFDIRNFLNIAELIDENYVVYAENGEDGLFRLKLFCVNPAVNLGEYLKKGRSAVFFCHIAAHELLQEIAQQQAGRLWNLRGITVFTEEPLYFKCRRCKFLI